MKKIPSGEGFKDKSSENILKAVNQLKSEMTFQKLMSGSCIFTNFGERKIEKILGNISYVEENIKTNKKINKENLLVDLNNIGLHKTGEQFIKELDKYVEYYNTVKKFFFKKKILVDENEDDNDSILQVLPSQKDVEKQSFLISGSKKKIELDDDDEVIEIQKSIKKIKLDDKVYSVVFSGFRDASLKKEAEKKNYKVVDSISKKIDYLVVGDLSSTSTKVEKAESYGIKIIDVNYFRSLLR
jgi:NAD-dependent DNA ligase